MAVAYREKPDLFGDPLSSQARKERRWVLWIFPMIVLAPNVGRIAKALGFKASYEIVFGGTIVMWALCIIGAIVSYRMTRYQVGRDEAEVNSVMYQPSKRD